ncbi:MAG: flagellar basal body rod protein FlgB [Rhodospirillaceae bacterium]
MDLGTMGVFKLMTKKMDWLAQRQEVIAENVANANTPKFKPEDMTPFTFRSALEEGRHKLEPVLTNPAHQSMLHPKDGAAGTARKEKRPYETKPDGNAVVVEEQMLKLSQAGQDFSLVTSLYRKNVNLFKLAIGRGGS